MKEIINNLSLQEKALIVLDETAAILGNWLENKENIQGDSEKQSMMLTLLSNYSEAIDLGQGEGFDLAKTSLGELLADYQLLIPFSLSWQAFALADDPLFRANRKEKEKIRNKALSFLFLSFLAATTKKLAFEQVEEKEKLQLELKTALEKFFGPTQPKITIPEKKARNKNPSQ